MSFINNKNCTHLLFVICWFVKYVVVVSGLKLSLTSDGPAVRGSNVSFTATVSGYGGENLKFVYWDDAQPQHTAEVTTNIQLLCLSM